ncbi:MAG: hypothetical protein IJB74_03110 [Clostridia bacterium]|nr:hypothetical protein [Clostridia bacterium]
MKKIISVLLAVMMLFALMSPCASAVSSRGNIPIIYIRGNGEAIYGPDGNKVPATFNDLELGGEGGLDKDAIVEACINIIKPFVAEGLIFDKWESYGKAIYEEIQPLFDGAQLDGNGDSLPGVGMHADSLWDNENSWNKNPGTYGLWDYQFHYDWRLSPYDHVDKLHEYIQRVMTRTGKDKVSIYTRCFGGSLGVAYLEKYGHLGHVDSVMFDATLNNGASVINDVFSGQIEFKSSRLQQYMAQLEQCDYYDVGFGLTIEGLANEIIFKTMDLFTQTGTADALFDGVEDLYTKLYKALMPAICFATGLATQANYWTCVYEKDFDAALNLMFGSKEAKEAYPGLIEKIKYYREHVTSKGDALYRDFADKYNIRIGAVGKYGYMNMPMSDSVNEPSDALVSLKDSTFGATVADIGSTLPKSYLASADPKYISADKMVDSSTALFPETTWIIKNAHHNFFGADDAVAQAFFFDKATVDTFSGLPQYIRYYEDELRYEPMTAENCEDYDWYSVAEKKPTTETILVSMMRWFKMILEIITKLLRGELSFGDIGK